MGAVLSTKRPLVPTPQAIQWQSPVDKTKTPLVLYHPPKVTTLSCMIRDLYRGLYHPRVIIVVCPSGPFRSVYTVHLIGLTDCELLAYAQIVAAELPKLKQQRAFKYYGGLISTAFVDMSNAVQRMFFVSTHMRTPNALHPDSPKPLYSSERFSPAACARKFLKRIHAHKDMHPSTLDSFFNLAENHKFKMYVRQKFCWRNFLRFGGRGPAVELMCVDVFLADGEHLGHFFVMEDWMKLMLERHEDLVFNIYKDPWHFLPIPTVLQVVLRMLTLRLGLYGTYKWIGRFLFFLFGVKRFFQ